MVSVAIYSILALALAFPFISAFFRSESILIRSHRAQNESERTHGLQLAIQFANQRVRRSRLPRIAIFPETLPSARVVRGPFGRGTLLMSQGLLSSFQDDEIVAVMHYALNQISKPSVPFRSACSVILAWIDRFRLKPWTPSRALVSITTLPIRNFLQRQDHALDLFRGIPQENPGNAWSSALRKVSYSERIFS